MLMSESLVVSLVVAQTYREVRSHILEVKVTP
jgi:hypothetical protein